jgi:class 3 adenylate cyclase
VSIAESLTTVSRTQILPAAVALFTDLVGFNHYSIKADAAAIEDLIDYWDDAHEEVAAAHGGTIRIVMADAYLLTFDNVPSAVAAWAELVAKGAEFPDPHLDGLHFCAGLEQGELRIYKNSVYGEASVRAMLYEHRAHAAGRDRLVLPLALAEQIDESLAPRLAIAPLADRLVVAKLKP